MGNVVFRCKGSEIYSLDKLGSVGICSKLLGVVHVGICSHFGGRAGCRKIFPPPVVPGVGRSLVGEWLEKGRCRGVFFFVLLPDS